MTTLSKLSTHLGLSMATVSRALNGYPEVNEKTKIRVLKAAKELGYKPNSAAKKLATGKSSMIGIMLQSPDELVCAPTFLKELSYISEYLGEKGYDLLINSSAQGADLDALKNFVSKSSIDGIIIKAPTINDERIEYLVQQGIPFVVHGWDMSDHSYAYFDIDNASVTEKSVNLLASLGHRKITFINASEQLAFAQQRRRAFFTAIENVELSKHDCKDYSCSPTVKEGYELAEQLLSDLDYKPSAFICSSVKVAYGLYLAAKELKLKIGVDISVIAHDDDITHFETDKFNPPLTVTRAPLTDSSKPIAEIITQLVEGKDPKQLKVLSPVELIVRDSTNNPMKK